MPQRLVISALFQAPQLHRGRVLNAAIGGWKLGVLETAESGPTFTVITTANTTNAFPAGPLRPNLLHDAALPVDQRTTNRWFDTSAYVNPAPLTFGNSPRGGLRGASVVSTDATLEKGFALTERWTLDIPGELYNLLDQAVFNVPGITFGAADFGVVSLARAPRTAQMALRLSF